MKKAIIFGASSFGRHVLARQNGQKDVLCFTDNNPETWGNVVDGVEIRSPSDALKLDFDEVIIGSLPGFNAIYRQLADEFNIPEGKINIMVANMFIEPRIMFIESLAQHTRETRGAVCECGVYQGEFAMEINRVFRDRLFYLFDTFEGFVDEDIQVEQDMGYSNTRSGSLSDTSIDAVREKLPKPEMCIFKKGYFPNTFDLDGESFIFVNLDMDLYKPTKAALEIFFPKMTKGGVILVHDYFNRCFEGVKVAVDEFCMDKNEIVIPIGDGLSIAIARR